MFYGVMNIFALAATARTIVRRQSENVREEPPSPNALKVKKSGPKIQPR